LRQLVERIRQGEVRAIARAISWIENENPEKEKLLDALYPYCGQALVWGVTGPPGAGKSSLLDRLIGRERARNHRIAVIAVDPSSAFSGGAILGDRLRMQQHAVDSGVFIRSMASRGHLGGIAGATRDAVKVFDAAGFDLVVVETIGVGQTEIEVMELADLVMLVLVPGMGDEIQALKAGVMEIGDIFVINKKDHDGSLKLQAEVEYVLGFKTQNGDAVSHPVVLTSATLDEGIDDLATALDDYTALLTEQGLLAQKREQRLAAEIRQIIATKVQHAVEHFVKLEDRIDGWVADILAGKAHPYALINAKISLFLGEFKQP
jgi:LAO/AO transport system kinase